MCRNDGGAFDRVQSEYQTVDLAGINSSVPTNCVINLTNCHSVVTKVSLGEVLHVPELRNDLLSVHDLVISGSDVIFRPEGAYVTPSGVLIPCMSQISEKSVAFASHIDKSFILPSTDANANLTPSASAVLGIAAEALNHLIHGKRHLLVQDIPSAVASLQEACRLVVECHGEMANECGEAYFYYGKALLELARDEAGVFGTVLDEDKEEEEENEKNEGSEDEDRSDGSETSSSADGETEEMKSSNSSAECADTSFSTINEVVAQPGSSTRLEDSKDTDSKDADDGEVTTLQLAWETLELAKIIFQRQAEGNHDILLKLAEVHLHLGEVGLESENYEQAVEDMQRCLAIRQNLLSQNDRLLAETHYQLGLALCFDNFYDDAIKHFQSAVSVMKDRIIGLKKKITTKSENQKPEDSSLKDDEPTNSILCEIEDLEEILPDIEEKIADTEDMKKNTADKLREAAFNTGLLSSDKERVNILTTKKPLELLSSFAGSSSEKVAKPISNIGHLVKRKRKPDDDPAVLTPLEKKPRAEKDLDFSSDSNSAQAIPTYQHLTVLPSIAFQHSPDVLLEGAYSNLSKNTSVAKNDLDVSSATLLPFEEKHQLPAVLDNEAMQLKSSSKTLNCVHDSDSKLISKSGGTLANGEDAKKVGLSNRIKDSEVKTSSN